MAPVDLKFYWKFTSKEPALVNIKFSSTSQISTSLE